MPNIEVMLAEIPTRSPEEEKALQKALDKLHKAYAGLENLTAKMKKSNVEETQVETAGTSDQTKETVQNEEKDGKKERKKKHRRHWSGRCSSSRRSRGGPDGGDSSDGSSSDQSDSSSSGDDTNPNDPNQTPLQFDTSIATIKMIEKILQSQTLKEQASIFTTRGKIPHYPKISAIRKLAKVCAPLEKDDVRTIPKFFKEFNERVASYIAKDRDRIPIFIELVRDSLALSWLTHNITSYVAEKNKVDAKPKLVDVQAMIANLLWDQKAQETKLQEFLDPMNDFDKTKDNMADYVDKWHATLRDSTMLNLDDPMQLILNKFPHDYCMWIQLKKPEGGVWTRDTLTIRIHEFYRENAERV